MSRRTPPAAFWFAAAMVFAVGAWATGETLVRVLGLVAAALAVWTGILALSRRHRRA